MIHKSHFHTVKQRERVQHYEEWSFPSIGKHVRVYMMALIGDELKSRTLSQICPLRRKRCLLSQCGVGEKWCVYGEAACSLGFFVNIAANDLL